MFTHRTSLKKLTSSSVLVAVAVGTIRIDRINGAIRIVVDMPDQEIDITEHIKPHEVEVERTLLPKNS